jgi:hypothetical protein
VQQQIQGLIVGLGRDLPEGGTTVDVSVLGGP